MVQFIKGSGRMENNMEKEKKHGQISHFMKGTIRMALNKVKEYTPGPMGICMKEIGLKVI